MGALDDARALAGLLPDGAVILVRTEDGQTARVGHTTAPDALGLTGAAFLVELLRCDRAVREAVLLRIWRTALPEEGRVWR